MRIQLEVHILDDFPAAVQAALLHTLVSSMLGRTVALSGRDAAQLPEEQDELNKFHEVVREGRARLEAGKNTVSHVSRSTSAYQAADIVHIKCPVICVPRQFSQLPACLSDLIYSKRHLCVFQCEALGCLLAMKAKKNKAGFASAKSTAVACIQQEAGLSSQERVDGLLSMPILHTSHQRCSACNPTVHGFLTAAGYFTPLSTACGRLARMEAAKQVS